MESPLKFFIVLAILIIPLLISITIHEWAHGMTAYKFGDDTPKKQGRLTLNPLAHLDPFGTLMLFIVGIGWAKPVEINPDNIPGKTKQMLVALAGPLSNFILAIIFSLVVFGLVHYSESAEINVEQTFAGLIIYLFKLTVQINIVLALFNLLPIPPLDGSNIIRWILPEPIAQVYSRLAPYGMFILLILVFTVGFSFIFITASVIQSYLYNIIEKLLGPLFGLM